MNLRRIVDMLLTILMIALMSFPATGQEAHERLGMIIFLVFMLHQALAWRWYRSLVTQKRWNSTRVVMTTVNFILLVLFLLTFISGAIMPHYTVLLTRFIKIDSLLPWARKCHMVCSYWCYIFVGLHLGLHWGMIANKLPHNRVGRALKVLTVFVAAWGFAVFSNSDIPNALTLRTEFIYLDYDKPMLRAMFETAAQLVTWTLVGYQGFRVSTATIASQPQKLLQPLMAIALTIVLSIPISIYLFYL